MIAKILSLSAILLTIFGFGLIKHARAEICPVGWYVSSVNKIELGPEHNGVRSISFGLVLFYHLEVSITGLTLSTENARLAPVNPIVSIERVYPALAIESFRNAYRDSDWFVQQAQTLIRGRKSITDFARGVPCNKPDFIPSRSHAEFRIEQGRRFERRHYNSHEVCMFAFKNDRLQKSWQEFAMDSLDNMITAEGSVQNFLFQFDAHHNLIVTKYGKESDLLSDKVLYNNTNVTTTSYTLNFMELIRNSNCRSALTNLVRPTKLTTDILNVPKPLKSVTGLDGMTYYMLGSSMVKVERKEELKILSVPNTGFGSPDPELDFNQGNKYPANDYTLEAMSFRSYGMNKPIDVRLIFTGKKKRTRLYLGYEYTYDFTNPRVIANHTSQDLTLIPDDITHWPMCDKIVSLYGYVYTIHNMNENILEDRSFTHALSLKPVFPIVAIHAEADDCFWFLSLQNQVIRAYASSALSCNELILGQPLETSLPQAFGMDVYVPNDKMFYDMAKREWYNLATKGTLKPPRPIPMPAPIPVPGPVPTPFPTPPPYPSTPAPRPVPAKSNFMTWIYVLCGIVLGVVVIIIIVMQILNSTTQSRPNVVYSRSKDMNQVSAPVQPQSTMPRASEEPHLSKESQATTVTHGRGMAAAASAMPLFSTHSSALKSVGSKGSRGSKVKRAGSSGGSGARSPKRSSPVARQSPKTTKTVRSASKSSKSPTFLR